MSRLLTGNKQANQSEANQAVLLRCGGELGQSHPWESDKSRLELWVTYSQTETLGQVPRLCKLHTTLSQKMEIDKMLASFEG